MKIDKQLPVATQLDVRAHSQAQLPEAPGRARPLRERRADTQLLEHRQDKSAGFNLQLNQQLSSMQSAERYLDNVAQDLNNLKLLLGRQLSNAQTSGERDSISRSLQQLDSLLQRRARESGEALDATFNLRLNEPLRSRFSVQGLESLEAIQRSGRETLLFSAGRQLAEPVAVVLDDDMSPEQVLRRFNGSLAQAGIRAELSPEGALRFSAPEEDWQSLKNQLRIQGEDKLFAKGATPVVSQQEGLFKVSLAPAQRSAAELRELLDAVVSALDRVNTLSDQISQRQADVRAFLARQESQDEKQWAAHFAGAVFNTRGQGSVSYQVISQAVVAQSNLSRFAVVSLLS